MTSRRAERGAAVTYEFQLETLWLIPSALATFFMLWVLWNLHKQIKR